jgi:hypothetical protein
MFATAGSDPSGVFDSCEVSPALVVAAVVAAVWPEHPARDKQEVTANAAVSTSETNFLIVLLQFLFLCKS